MSCQGLVEGMATQRAVRYFLLKHCYDILGFDVFTVSHLHAFVKWWGKQHFGTKVILETSLLTFFNLPKYEPVSIALAGG